jgi:hypothetical protein
MTRYRFRGIFLLFLMGHATACTGGSSSWQSPGLSPSLDSADVSGGNSLARYIEAARPDQVRITTEDRTQYLLYSPSVVGDEIVSSDGLSVPIADIVNLEIWRSGTVEKSTTLALSMAVIGVVGYMAIWFLWPGCWTTSCD